ncbi:PSP1 domain-containing protein [Chrysiogenes arsenatis]|uniref:PSP1 domain-containing protein n=1 Tax=Chrysiogenes arsenatis TaxID=309797 RepID=UPI00040E3AE4
MIVGPAVTTDRDKNRIYRRIIRLANPDDIAMIQANRELEKYAFELGGVKVRKHNLPMKLVRVEYLFDASKITFYFTADGRIDFRELVKDLAFEFKTRIEMRQVGVRDETKLLGGFGPCGRPCCCSQFLRDFAPVSIKMAKEQNLNLSPTKISGLCGRLMCCLVYEHSQYEQALVGMPAVDSNFDNGVIKGIVKKLNPLKKTIIVQTETGKWEEIDLSAEAVAPQPTKTCGYCNGGKCRSLCRTQPHLANAPADDHSDRSKSSQNPDEDDFFEDYNVRAAYDQIAELSESVDEVAPARQDEKPFLSSQQTDDIMHSTETSDEPESAPSLARTGRSRRSKSRRGGADRSAKREKYPLPVTTDQAEHDEMPNRSKPRNATNRRHDAKAPASGEKQYSISRGSSQWSKRNPGNIHSHGGNNGNNE